MLTLDCENSCRVCLIESDKLSGIFEGGCIQDERTAAEILTEISGVEISQEDKLSKKICEDCKSKALELSAFRQLCIDSDETVRYNLLLEDQEETLVESLENEEFQETQEEGEVMEVENEDSFMEDEDDSGNAEEYEVYHLEEDQTIEEIKLEASNNIVIVKKDASLEYATTEELTAKMRAAHFAKEQLKKHKCPYCDKTFMYPSKVNRHVIAVHKDLNKPKKIIKKNHCCHICGKAFVSHFKVRRHMVVHDTELKSGLQKNWTRNYFLCQHCMRKFHTQATYDRHTIICDMLMKSDIARPPDYEYMCAICTETFNNHDEMVEHMKNIHQKQDPEILLDCQICSKFSSNCNDLIKHGRYHEENATYRCCLCDKYFPNGDEIISHLLRHANYKPHECTHEGCTKKFFDRYKLKTHMESHDPSIAKQYICDHCQRPFAHLDYLTCHIRRKHSNVKPYQCTYCTKSFAFHHDLNLHLTVHTGNKKHVCVICSASFTKSWSLKQHMVIHEIAQTKFNCNICPFSTSVKVNLNKHLATHKLSSGIAFICGECGEEFKSENELKFHLEEAHQNQYAFIDANSSDPYALEEIPSNY